MTPSSPPANLWGHLAAKAARLELAVGLLSLTVVLLGGTLAWYAWHGLPVHYIPPGGPGLSQPGVIPDAVATDYASRWLTARYTFTPATVKAAHAQILTALHPSLTVAFTAQAEREATLVKEAQLSTQVMIATATVTRRMPQEVTVRLEARRTIWIGGQQVRDEPVHADLTVVPWLAAGAPAGLVVVRVTMTPTLSAPGT
jgi:hypothetical protein